MLHYFSPEALAQYLPNYQPAENDEGLNKGEGHFPQGHSVFECNTDESQCLRRLGSQPAASRRSGGLARPP